MARTGSASKPGREGATLTLDALHTLALRYLGRYAVSEKGLADYLTRKARQASAKAAKEDPAIEADDREVIATRIAETIARMRELQLLDDAGFAAMRVDALQKKGFSRRRIAADLARKGVAEDAAGQNLDALDPLEQARLFARRKRLFGQPGETGEKAAKRREKALATLARQGFSYSIARQVLDEGPEAGESPGTSDEP